MLDQAAQECAIGASIALVGALGSDVRRLRLRAPFLLLAASALAACVAAERREAIGVGPSPIRIVALVGALVGAATIVRVARVQVAPVRSLPVAFLAMLFGISCISHDVLSVFVDSGDLRGATVERYLMEVFFPLSSTTLGIALASVVLARSACSKVWTQISAALLSAVLVLGVGLSVLVGGQLALLASWAICLVPVAAALRRPRFSVSDAADEAAGG